MGISVDPTAAIPLERGQVNTAIVVVKVTADGAWHLTTLALGAGASHGHMRLTPVGTAVLSAPMEVRTAAGDAIGLATAVPVVIDRGSGSVTVPVRLEQSVSPTDRPGTYEIRLVFEAITGF